MGRLTAADRERIREARDRRARFDQTVQGTRERHEIVPGPLKPWQGRKREKATTPRRKAHPENLGRREALGTVTPAQLRVLRLYALGMRQASIAAFLNISPATVAVHMVRCRVILGATNTAHAVALAIRSGQLW